MLPEIRARTMALRVAGSTFASIARMLAEIGSVPSAVITSTVEPSASPAETLCGTEKSTFTSSETPWSVVSCTPSFRY